MTLRGFVTSNSQAEWVVRLSGLSEGYGDFTAGFCLAKDATLSPLMDRRVQLPDIRRTIDPQSTAPTQG